jgi:hypothetical protein
MWRGTPRWHVLISSSTENARNNEPNVVWRVIQTGFPAEPYCIRQQCTKTIPCNSFVLKIVLRQSLPRHGRTNILQPQVQIWTRCCIGLLIAFHRDSPPELEPWAGTGTRPLWRLRLPKMILVTCTAVPCGNIEHMNMRGSSTKKEKMQAIFFEIIHERLRRGACRLQEQN